ncbi:hypothetical protein [Streptomyces guryensis]|uniref:Uncharacterized protein n=1 Tax=Streptomyces guryensis TaxID=2886947 RepID=A0A9Q3VQR9_9ACTN|nr:hypothetical protein [Streptomyces guryensis]MCD9878358.1 hypothetical protein [Streptomyces guryensis]
MIAFTEILAEPAFGCRRNERQLDQRHHRAVRAEHPVGELEERIRPASEAVVELDTKVEQDAQRGVSGLFRGETLPSGRSFTRRCSTPRRVKYGRPAVSGTNQDQQVRGTGEVKQQADVRRLRAGEAWARSFG